MENVQAFKFKHKKAAELESEPGDSDESSLSEMEAVEEKDNKNYIFLMKSLRSIGYTVHMEKLNSVEAAYPHSRTRLYFLGMLTGEEDHTLKDDLAFQLRYHLIYPMEHFNKFLLTEKETEVFAQQVARNPQTRSLVNKKNSEHKSKKAKVAVAKEPKWIQQCKNIYESHGLNFPSQADFPSLADREVYASLMTLREEAILLFLFHTSLLPSSEKLHFYELSQSVNRSHAKADFPGCLCPGSRIFVTGPGMNRFLYGAEALMLQGLPRRMVLEVAQDECVSDRGLFNLAGNAFCAGCVATAFVSLYACGQV